MDPLELKLWVFMSLLLTCLFRTEVGSFTQIGQILKALSLLSSSSIFDIGYFHELEILIDLYWSAIRLQKVFSYFYLPRSGISGVCSHVGTHYQIFFILENLAHIYNGILSYLLPFFSTRFYVFLLT